MLLFNRYNFSQFGVLACKHLLISYKNIKVATAEANGKAEYLKRFNFHVMDEKLRVYQSQ